jgi:hypothetical protein
MKQFHIKGIITAFLYATCLLNIKQLLANPGAAVTGTYVLDRSQYPAPLKKFSPAGIYVIYTQLYSGSRPKKPVPMDTYMRGDTIFNLKKFIESKEGGISGYRLVFGQADMPDSVWQTNGGYNITDKAYPAGKGLLKILAFDNTGKLIDQFVFNYYQKYKDENRNVPPLGKLFRIEQVYSRYDRNKYAVGEAWVLSIGVNFTGNAYPAGKCAACESDATLYNQFFSRQYSSSVNFPEGYHEYLLLGKKATKENILSALMDIASKAAPNDYFIFNFSGYTHMFTFDSLNFITYFFPYSSSGVSANIYSRARELKEDINNHLISLKVLQEHIQLIPAKNQLFISEAGPSGTFKSEFIKTMMQGSPAIASLLNVNRIIMVPDYIGLETRIDSTDKIAGVIAHSITSLDTGNNIFHLFGEDYRSAGLAAILKAKAYKTNHNRDYFDVFFERKFLQQYRDIFGDAEKTRGGIGTNKELQKNPALKGNRHALIIGTDNYRAKGWDKLNNPVYDASEIAGILAEDYSYEVQLLKDPPMDSVYQAIREYYKTLKQDDQLIIYIAGHGDYDKDLLDDGFIVCADSKSVEDDPLRNTYIQHTKLKKMINKIPASKIMVMLDICYGGFFDEEVRDNPASSITNRNVLELLHKNAQYKVRKMLSSVGTEPAFDGKAGKHSPFAGYLISVLNAKGGSEGIITLSDIYTLLQKASLNETTNLKISPHVAGFGDNNPLGEFILIPLEKAKQAASSGEK